MVRQITQIGDPVLRRVCKEILPEEISDPEVQELIDDLIDTKRAANGAGIAAPQIGVLKRVFIVENINNPNTTKPEFPLTIVINPKITFLSDERFDNVEGCLSIPQLRGALPRCPEIRVQGYGRDGNSLDFEVRGVSAGIFQHENDHLDGILFPDRMTDMRTLTTWDEFKKNHLGQYREELQVLIDRYSK